MTQTPHDDWAVDLAARTASRGRDVVRFDAGDQASMAIAFVASAAASLEEQCLIAGEATFAIWETIKAADHQP